MRKEIKERTDNSPEHDVMQALGNLHSRGRHVFHGARTDVFGPLDATTLRKGFVHEMQIKYQEVRGQGRLPQSEHGLNIILAGEGQVPPYLDDGDFKNTVEAGDCITNKSGIYYLESVTDSPLRVVTLDFRPPEDNHTTHPEVRNAIARVLEKNQHTIIPRGAWYTGYETVQHAAYSLIGPRVTPHEGTHVTIYNRELHQECQEGPAGQLIGIVYEGTGNMTERTRTTPLARGDVFITGTTPVQFAAPEKLSYVALGFNRRG
ncbi:MAG: hypothetical protein OXR66_04585 [Candidatus Woesearchaeota archaeon]|nr:hypothetical protein [Candidatus Woesearchaeota archaeon]